MLILNDYFKKQAENEIVLCFRHPWFNLAYNWLILALVVMLFGGFVWWGMQIHTQRMADEMLETALAAMDAEHAEMMAAAEAQEAELKASQEYIMEQEATAVAKAFYGINRFVEKYNYSSDDLATYARCMFNRAEKADLQEVVAVDGQFTGYSDDNPVLAEYYNLALRLVREWHEETVKPCDVSFQFAELTPNGIYLRNQFKADGYARRWHMYE